MRRRPVALALLFLAVVCSPAGVCVVEGMAATVQAAEPPRAHACRKQAEATLIGASKGYCCTEGRKGFVNVSRFPLQEQAAPSSLAVATRWTPRAFVMDISGFGRAAPLVLRI